MDYYPDQLRVLAALCESLNEIDRTNESTIALKTEVAVVDTSDDDRVLGHLVDEIGGAWSFRPVTASADEPGQDEDVEDEDVEDEDGDDEPAGDPL